MRRVTAGSSAILLAILMSSSTAFAASNDRAPTSAPAPAAPAPAPPLTITAIAAGADHVCALTTGGGVVCWGSSVFGQLGNGPTTQSSVPVAVSGLSAGVTAIAAGRNHTCALTNRGGVACWGQNTNGQLGNGTTTQSSVPVAVSGLSAGVSAIAASGGHSCALTGGGGAKCWGDNYVGQTGNGVAGRSLVPVDITGRIGGFTASSGNNHTCALTSAGGAACWGYNYVGQLGNGTTNTSRSTSFIPVDVLGLTRGVTAISAGFGHTCALTKTGAIMCWGYNLYGQLGSGTRVNANAPVGVSGLARGGAAISAGGSHTCALTSGGEVTCWGANNSGQLGNGSSVNSTTPRGVSGITAGVTAIATGRDHACALTSRGEVKCWGANWYGQLGNGTTTSSRVPVEVDFARAGRTTVAISAGSGHTCALTVAGGVRCWGANYYDQLGNRATTGSLTPVDVAGLPGPVVAIAAGGASTCALTSAGAVKCWGQNQWGQLGDGTTIDSPTPVDVVGLSSGVRAISVADMHACAVMLAGTALCWGYNQYGELGTKVPVRGQVNVPVPAGPAGGVLAISTGAVNTCALSTAGAASCWGSTGTVGYATTQQSSTPVAITGLASGVRAISAGFGQTCALTGASAAVCWGTNGHGELGIGSTTSATTPVQVSGLASGVRAIATGSTHTCALTSAGAAMCWGDGHYGMLGDGTTIQRTVPVAVQGLAGGVVAISAGWGHTCALLVDGRVMCWGHGNLGELGYGRTSNSAVPVAVDFAIHPTIVLRSSTPSGAIAQGTTVTLTATVSPPEAAGVHPRVRFVISRLDDGVWRTAASRDVTVDASGRATLRWGFLTVGERLVRARVVKDGIYAWGAWSRPLQYTVR